MKILYVLDSSNYGGMELHVLDLLNFCNSYDHKAYIFCPEGALVTEYKNAGAEVIIKNIKFDFDPFFVRDLVKFVANNQIDIVHSHELKASANCMIAKLFMKIPLVTHVHTPISEWKIPAIKKAINLFIYPMGVRFGSDVEIALTESRKKTKVGEGIPENKLRIIPNCVPDGFKIDNSLKVNYRNEIRSKFGISDSTFLVGNLSRLSVEKDHETLIKAFEIFSKNTPDSKLLIMSDGVLRETLQNLVNSLSLNEKVIFGGHYSQEDKIKLLSALDLFAFTSTAEGFGIVLIEAMSAGIPTVCSDLQVLQEVGGSDVFYFETHNPENLAQKFRDIYLKKDRLGLMTENSKKRVDELFSYRVFCEGYSELYNSLLSR